MKITHKKEIPMRASIKEFMHEIKICAKNQCVIFKFIHVKHLTLFTGSKGYYTIKYIKILFNENNFKLF